jgi:hypothetical protein
MAGAQPPGIAVDPATLRKEQIGTGSDFRWTVQENGNPQRKFVLLGQETDKTMLKIRDGMPIVREAIGGTGERIPFMGNLDIIKNALTASGNKVMFLDSPGNGFTVDPAGITRVQETDPTKFVYTTTAPEKPNAILVFMAEGTDPQKLRIQENKPVVFMK